MEYIAPRNIVSGTIISSQRCTAAINLHRTLHYSGNAGQNCALTNLYIHLWQRLGLTMSRQLRALWNIRIVLPGDRSATSSRETTALCSHNLTVLLERTRPAQTQSEQQFHSSPHLPLIIQLITGRLSFHLLSRKRQHGKTVVCVCFWLGQSHSEKSSQRPGITVTTITALIFLSREHWLHVTFRRTKRQIVGVFFFLLAIVDKERARVLQRQPNSSQTLTV